jgi:hypothetical protein
MHPGVVIEHDPESIHLQRTQIRDHADEHVLEAFLVKGQGKVMMVDDVVPLSRTHDNRNHMATQKLADLLGDMRPQMVALLVHFPHADGHLGRAQGGYRDGLQNGVAHDDHDILQDHGREQWRPV